MTLSISGCISTAVIQGPEQGEAVTTCEDGDQMHTGTRRWLRKWLATVSFLSVTFLLLFVIHSQSAATASSLGRGRRPGSTGFSSQDGVNKTADVRGLRPVYQERFTALYNTGVHLVSANMAVTACCETAEVWTWCALSWRPETSPPPTPPHVTSLVWCTVGLVLRSSIGINTGINQILIISLFIVMDVLGLLQHTAS